MAIPEVGKTHDVVIYDAAGNIPPVGLVLRPFSLRVAEAPSFIPRMAVGDPRGTDYATFTSEVQSDWRGQSQVKKGATHDYYRMVGMVPSRRTGDLVPISGAVCISVSGFSTDWRAIGNFSRRTLVVHGVDTTISLTPYSTAWTNTRIFCGQRIWMPQPDPTYHMMTGLSGKITGIQDIGTLLYSCDAYDAVQWSGVAFITPVITTFDGSYSRNIWGGIQAHIWNTVYLPDAHTAGQCLAVYDERLWRSEPEGHRIAYYEVREPPTAHDTNQGTCTYEGEHGDAEFKDDAQDFQEWETTDGDARYKVVVTNDDATECWGYIGAASESGNNNIEVFKDKPRDTRGWNGDTDQPVTDSKVVASYEVRYAVPPEEENTAWSDYTELAPSVKIRAMEPFIGRLFMGCEDGLWAYEAGRTYRVVDLSHLASRDNFQLMKAAYGSLWFNVGHSLYRYTSGGLLEEMDAILKNEGTGHPAHPQAVAPGPGCVYIATGGHGGFPAVPRSATYYRLDMETGAIQEMTASNYLATMSFWAAGTVFAARQAVRSNLKRDWRRAQLLIGPLLTSLDGQGVWTNNLTLLNLGWTDEVDSETDWTAVDGLLTTEDCHYVETVWFDLGYPALVKTWIRCTLELELLPLGGGLFTQEVTIRYRTYPGTWSDLGTVDADDIDSDGRVTLEFPANLQSKTIQLKMSIGYETSLLFQVKPKISLLELDALFGGARMKRWQFSAIVTDDLELLDRSVENSAAFVAASIFSLSGSGALHTVGVPYPYPMGHTIKGRVELGPTGAMVPVLAYSGMTSSVMGTDVAITVTEV